ncbi:MAG: peptidoglycan-binding protein [Acidimicrobiales bacterium]
MRSGDLSIGRTVSGDGVLGPPGSGGQNLEALTTPEGATDLQRRLARQSLLQPPFSGKLDHQTATAVRAFQDRRGLRVDGVCGPQTWTALVEAGYFPGDRLLYLRAPMMQGDDVAELQRQLGTLGFDAGRIDGIFGVLTARALIEFQRNVAVAADGICGQATLAELHRLRSKRSEGSLVGSVRERQLLRQGPRTLFGRRIAIGHQGGLGAAVQALRHALSAVGAEVTPLLHPDGTILAKDANAFGADVYVGIHLDPSLAVCRVAYYRGYRYESAGGHHLAELCRERIGGLLPPPNTVSTIGMAIPELRHSKMPAVVCELAPPSLVVERAGELGAALVAALSDWVSATWE